MGRHRKTLSDHLLRATAFAILTVPIALVAQESGNNSQVPSGNDGIFLERAELLLSQMTLEQKIQQLANKPEEVDFPEGTYLASGGRQATCEFTRIGRRITGIPELGIPTIREINGGNGVRGGDCIPEPVRTAGPSTTLAAASFDPQLMYAWGEVVGNEARTFAHQIMLGPALNLIRSPYAGRAQEYPGEDPYLAGIIGSAQVRGIQSQGVHSMIKHFAGNEHEFNFERWTAASRIPSRALHELYLLPFEMAVRDAKPAGIMCAYPHLNGSWACDSEELLQQTLRDRWGFDGWIESDRRAMHSTVDSLLAGVGYELDEMPVFYSEENIKAAIAAGEITEEDVDAVLLPRYTKMYEFGFFDNNYNRMLPVDFETNGAKARALAEAGIVLLKNEESLLPLDAAEVQSIALIGHPWFAGSATIPPRNGDPAELTTVIPPFTVTPQQGLEQYVPAVTYNDGRDIAAAVQLAQNSDVVILGVGTTPRETRDLTTIRLPTFCSDSEQNPDGEDAHELGEQPNQGEPAEICLDQEELIRQVSAVNPKTVVVLYSGAGVVMDWVDQVPALIAAWFPGQEDGDIIADIVFGALNPSGKLPVTFPNTEREAAFATEAQYPGLHEFTGIPGGPGREGDPNLPQLVSRYLEGLEMGYRWYEANAVTPRFPFGHGLSYTTFEYSHLKLKRSFRPEYEMVEVKLPNSQKPRVIRKLKDIVPVLTAEFHVTNTGTVAGGEAAQVYLQLPHKAQQPAKRLVGFQKVFLNPGESAQVSVEIEANASNHPFSHFVPTIPDYLPAWAEGEWETEDGYYRVLVGGSSADTPLIKSIAMVFPDFKKWAVWPDLFQKDTVASMDGTGHDTGHMK